MSELRAYAPRGICAIQPQAFGLEYPAAAKADELCMLSPTVALVEINGPMVHVPDGHFRTYRSIVEEVRAACEAPGIATVVIKLSSPGGDVFGNFDASREIRSIATAAGKRLVAYSDASCCSAAYALACAADEIVIADTAVIGSVGVITMLVDQTRLDGAMGLSYTVIKSGARKADGNAHAGTTDAAIEAMQAMVDQTAGVFYGLVAERRGLTPETVAAYQAAVFVGANAIGVGLANSVESFSAFKTRISESRTPVVSTETPSMADEDKDKPVKEDAVRAALVTASESDDADKAAKAKRALAAYDDENAKAEDEKPEPKDEEEDSKASASLAKAVAPLAQKLAAQQAELAALKAEADASKRASLFAARPDLKPELIESLKATPTSALKAVIDAIQVPAGFVNPHVPVLGARPTQGANGGRPGMSANAALNEQMGLVKKTQGVTYEANSQVFGGSK